MSVTPHELLAAARAIPQTDEASRRTVIHSLYYAAYQAAYDFHCSLPIPGSVGDAKGKHEQLIAQLSKPGVNSGHPTHMVSRRLGIILGALFALRIRADYKPKDTITSEDVDMALFHAEDIFKNCYPPVQKAPAL